MIKIGTKVKCIKDGNWKTFKQSNELEDKIFENPIFGNIYVVTNVTELDEDDKRIKELELTDNIVFWLDGMGEQCFTTRRFEVIEE
jgi:hypothetical protein